MCWPTHGARNNPASWGSKVHQGLTDPLLPTKFKARPSPKHSQDIKNKENENALKQKHVVPQRKQTLSKSQLVIQ